MDNILLSLSNKTIKQRDMRTYTFYGFFVSNGKAMQLHVTATSFTTATILLQAKMIHDALDYTSLSHIENAYSGEVRNVKASIILTEKI